MTTPRMMFAFDRADIEDLFRESTEATPIWWECDCGCKTALAYGRDRRALWICPEVDSEPTIRLTGFETFEELSTFLDLMAARLNKKTMDQFRPVMMAAWKQGKETPS
jgi:hypothetical protein